ncbi:MAG: hypothetical protein BAJATHORv1_10110 [Candidatus Thorarchaeota archaeon]|nr:MAG: hypothetical protein BAJATHORv1_10110 [Candidatus Thorarchaeota archaeon]
MILGLIGIKAIHKLPPFTVFVLGVYYIKNRKSPATLLGLKYTIVS